MTNPPLVNDCGADTRIVPVILTRRLRPTKLLRVALEDWLCSQDLYQASGPWGLASPGRGRGASSAECHGAVRPSGHRGATGDGAVVIPRPVDGAGGTRKNLSKHGMDR